MPETTESEAEGGYEADAPHRCHRCDALAKKRAEFEEAPRPEALVIWPARRKN